MKVFGTGNASDFHKISKSRKENRKTEHLYRGFPCETGQKTECGVRNLPFSQCDKVRICITEGYTLKAKADGRQVYVEKKMEDGTTKGYEINPYGIQAGTKDPVEKIAWEAWEKNKKEEKQMTVTGIGGCLYNMYKTHGVKEQTEAEAETAGGQSSNEILGSAMIPWKGPGAMCEITAQYDDDSTQADPVIRVNFNYGGEQVSYRVSVNDIHPRNASMMEMFALCCYADEHTFGTGTGSGLFQSLKAYAESAGMNDIDFAEESADWVEIVNQVMDSYGQTEAGYKEYQDGVKFLGLFYKAGADEELAEEADAIFSGEKISEYLNVLRKFRDEEFRTGDMAGYHETAEICNDLLNIRNDLTGKNEYMANLAGFSGTCYQIEGRLQSGILGFGVIGNGDYHMTAVYADNSTADNPIVRVRIGHMGTDKAEEYLIAVNDIDPRNASQLEMFALCSHADAQGLSQIRGSYMKLLYYAEYGQNGCTTDNLADFVSKKRDWEAAIRDGITEEMGLKDKQAAIWKELLLHFLEQFAKNYPDEIEAEEDIFEETAEEEDSIPQETIRKLFEDRES